MNFRLHVVALLLFALVASNEGAFSRITSTDVEPNGNLLNDGVRTLQSTAWNLPKLISKTTGTGLGSPACSTLAYDYDASQARINDVSLLRSMAFA